MKTNLFPLELLSILLLCSCYDQTPEPALDCDYFDYDAEIVNQLDEEIKADLYYNQNGVLKVRLTNYEDQEVSEPLPVDCIDYTFSFKSHDLLILMNCCHNVITILED